MEEPISRRPAAGGDAAFGRLPLSQQLAHFRYALNWQWTALRMQHERLTASTPMSPYELVEASMQNHMRGVVDMDFLVLVVRRLLRVAEQLRRSGCDPGADMKIPIRSFSSRWEHVIGVRNSLEHVDSPGLPIVPMQSSDPAGKWAFLVAGKSLSMQDLFQDAESLCRVMHEVIERSEA